MVRLHGLSTGYRYNGHVGTVVARPTEGRWGVRLHATVWPPEDGCAYKEISVKQMNATRVRVPPPAPRGGDAGGAVAREEGASEEDAEEEGELVSAPPSAQPPRCAVLPLLRARLPEELSLRVRSFLEVRRVDMRRVTARACSSSHGQCPIGEALTARRDTWWISAPGTVSAEGEGVEWLEFDLGAAPRCVSFVGVAIPPLPAGPLSTRRFHVQRWCAHNGGAFVDCGGQASADRGLLTLDAGDVQEFALTPAVVTRRVRIVCTQVAQPSPMAECIGLYEVRFR